jgi:hypothetical protein
MTEWTDLVTKVYNENKGKPGYKFKNALKDAAKIYKKSKKRSVIKAKPSRKRRGTRKA